MGSHYIQVGKLKIDQDLMDVICPAAGFTPELICTPANGYIPDPGAPYIPPIDIGVPNEEEITLLCADSFPGYVSFRTSISSAKKYYVEVYNSLDVLIETSDLLNNSAQYTYWFPTNDGKYYKLIIRPEPTYSITSFYISSLSGYPTNQQVLQAKFNTPNITSLASAFFNIIAIKSCEFISSLDYLTTLYYTFSGSGINYFKFPDSLPALTTLQSCFSNSDIIRIDSFAECYLPILNNLSSFVNATTNLMALSMPYSLPELTNISYMCRDSNIRSLSLPTSMPKITTAAYMIDGCLLLEGEVIVPEMPLCTTLAYFASDCVKLNKLRLLGDYSSLTTFQNLLYKCANVELFEMPRILVKENITVSNMLYNTTSLQYLILPDVWSASSIPRFSNWSINYVFKSITGNFLNVNCQFEFQSVSKYNEIIDCPNMRCSYFAINGNQGMCAVKYVNIDWVNSNFNLATSVVLQISADLDAAELDRIGALITSGTGKTAKLSLCTGYSTMNQTLWTDKGWTLI